MELAVVNVQGKETGKKVSLNAEIFGAEPNEHAIYLDIKQHLANSRQGTHKSKERGEINRTTKKHHKQKGTGGARYGSLRGPLHRGGGTAFGGVGGSRDAFGRVAVGSGANLAGY